MHNNSIRKHIREYNKIIQFIHQLINGLKICNPTLIYFALAFPFFPFFIDNDNHSHCSLSHTDKEHYRSFAYTTAHTIR